MKKFRQFLIILLSVVMVTSIAPVGMAWALEADQNTEVTEVPANAGTSDEVSTEQENSPSMEENEPSDTAVEESTEDVTDGESVTLNEDLLEESGDEGSEEINIMESDNGEVTEVVLNEGTITGTATPDDDYDLATVRYNWEETVDDAVSEHHDYVDYEAMTKKENSYSFSFDVPENAENLSITASFFNTKVWDGAVDISWYDPSKKEFNIYTPAQLAGLAAIVNGTVDLDVTKGCERIDDGFAHMQDGIERHKFHTEGDMIKGDAAQYLIVEEWGADLTSEHGGGTRDVVYRLPKVRKSSAIASDDLYNDFRYRTVNIMADMNMNKAEMNFAPIGGKYSIQRDQQGEFTIDTRFQGILDGNGHNVDLYVNCNIDKNFAYSMCIGFVGYLGGGVDFDKGYPKDCKITYAKTWVPTVRNLVVSGEVYGRRLTGGIVGHMGQTADGCLIENCANKADVTTTDMRGCAGIVGAAWGIGTVRNCYNTGDMDAQMDEVGGIVGSNGYEHEGLSIYNCYNVGTITEKDEYCGKEIGYDGGGYAPYSINNCYYIKPAEVKEGMTGYRAGLNYRCIENNVVAMPAAEMKTQDMCDKLNANGSLFVHDDSINDGYPCLYFESGSSHADSYNVSVKSTTNGSVTADRTGSVPFGTTITLSAESDDGYYLDSYTVNGKTITGDFYTVTEDIEISGTFTEIVPVKVVFDKSDTSTFRSNVVKLYDAATKSDVEEILNDGDTVIMGDRIKITGVLVEGAEPADKTLEFTGDFENTTILNKSTVKKVINRSNQYEVTGKGDITFRLQPSTRGKTWYSIADTSWYNKTDKVFTVNTAAELAGIARLLYDYDEELEDSEDTNYQGDLFEGKTIKLGSDIDLTNPEDPTVRRNWMYAGMLINPFKGTFDGQGHTISNLNRHFNMYDHTDGGYGGLFVATDGATIKNLTISGTFDGGTTYTGAFVGKATDTTIENCINKMNILESRYSGGIVGTSRGKTIIKDCSNEGVVSGYVQLGGIVGVADAPATSEDEVLSISGCTNSGEVVTGVLNKGDQQGQYFTTNETCMGGILGYASSAATVNITDCGNTGTVLGHMSTKATNKQNAVGGIVAYSAGKLNVTRAYNVGSVIASGYAVSLGGIAGYLGNSTGKESLVSCYNIGKLHSDAASDKAVIGGIANTYRASTIKNCYNAGTIDISSGGYTDNCGGFSGVQLTANMSNNYCLDTVGYTDEDAVGGNATVVSKAELEGLAEKLGTDYAENDKAVLDCFFPVFPWQIEGYVPKVGTVTLSSVKASTTTSISLTWKLSTGVASKYYIYTSTDGKKFSYLKSTTLKSYKHTVKPGTKHYYYIVPVFTAAGVDYKGTKSKTLSATTGLNKPTISRITNLKGRKAKITWKKDTNVSGYEVYYSTKKTSGFKKASTIKKYYTVSYTKKSLKKKKTYYFKIRSYKKIGTTTIRSAYSSVKSVKIKK